MNSYTSFGFRLAAFLTSTIAFGGLIVATPAFADYGANSNVVSNYSNSSSYAERFNPNAIVEQWNYINTQSVQPISYPYTNTYQTGYQASRYVPMYYPTYSNSEYNYSYSNTPSYQYSYQYQYVEPVQTPVYSSYNYSEPYDDYSYSNNSSSCNNYSYSGTSDSYYCD